MNTFCKITAIGLAGLFALAAAGCGGGNAPAKTENASAKVLKVGTTPNYPPFEFHQEKTDAYTGFDIELIRAVAERLGYEKVEFVDVDFTQILSELDAKKYDVAAAAIEITPEREKKVLFSTPYIKTGNVIVAPHAYSGEESAAVLANKKVAVEDGAITAALAKENDAEPLPCPSSEEALAKLAKGDADFAILDHNVAVYLLENGHADEGKIFEGVSLGDTGEVGIAIRKDDAEMQKKVNDALADFMRTTNYDQLKKSYFGEHKH